MSDRIFGVVHLSKLEVSVAEPTRVMAAAGRPFSRGLTNFVNNCDRRDVSVYNLRPHP